MPQHILTELNPLFKKAKLITANKAMQNPEKSILDTSNSDGHFGAMRPSIIGQLGEDDTEILHFKLHQSSLSLDKVHELSQLIDDCLGGKF